MVGPMVLFSAFVNGAALALYNGSPLGRGFGKFVQVCGKNETPPKQNAIFFFFFLSSVQLS